MLKIIPLDAEREPYRAPDLIWDGEAGDLKVNTLTHDLAPGDFRAEQGLATQVLICLMTDARVDDSELPDGVENRGWFGDSFDQAEGETPIGSKLWLLRRRSIYDGIETDVEDYVREALQTLIDQGVIVSLDVVVTADRSRNRLDYEVSLYGKSGTLTYNQKFQLLRDQIDGVANPLGG
jgi:phage gp46-like protein